MMSRKLAVEPGDIVAVPLGDKMVAAGIVLHISTVFRGSMMIGFYNKLFTSVEEIDVKTIGGNFIETPNYTGKQLITKGRWKVIGNSQELLEAASIPQLRVVNTLYYKDEIVKQIRISEFKKYVQVAGQGGFFIEDKLRKYFEQQGSIGKATSSVTN